MKLLAHPLVSRSPVAIRPSPFFRQRGVALVITLIMLAIITFLAVTFLLIARRERMQVTQASSLTDAEVAATAGRERAIGEVMARIAASNQLGISEMLVSTNVDITNTFLGIQNDPRPPVFLPDAAGNLDFRFYLDLNRNGRYDQTLPEAKGDPEWIGVMNLLGGAHTNDNRFMYRYAYIALPVGMALDLNVNHNQAKRPPNPTMEGFLRNQGYGSWEINLAAFLTDLNTNQWNYVTFDTDPTLQSSGTAFDDGLSLVRYRVANDYRTGQKAADDLFGLRAPLLTLDRLDSYGNGPVQLASNLFQTINLDASTPFVDTSNQSWPGAASTNKYFTPWDLFDANKTSAAFTNRLRTAGQQTNAYDGQVFYRLLEALSTDTAPLKLTNHINLNYDNVYTNAQSLTAWNATDFFMTTADRLIRARSNEFGFTITNILIWEPNGQTNLYTQELHQLLQMTANIYDSARNDVGLYPDYPTVFRPIFEKGPSNEIYIVRYQEETNTAVLNAPLRDLNISTDRTALQPADMVWGVPLIIGARKGYPNFNEFSLQTYVQVTRKLAFRRPSTNSLPNATNQMWVLGISNVVGAECWNSYTSAFPRPLEMRMTNIMMVVLTNEQGYPRLPNAMPNPPIIMSSIPVTTIAAGGWLPGQMRIPMYTNVTFLPNAGFFVANNEFKNITPNPGFDLTPGFPAPQWGLRIVNKFFYALVDTTTNRIVDYVNLQGLDSVLDVTAELIADNNIIGEPSAVGSMWITNRVGGGNTVLNPTEGVINQIEVCLGNRTVGAGDWRSYNDQAGQGMDKEKSIDTFRVFMGLTPLRYQRAQLPLSGLVQQSPFSPTRKLYVYTSWQVNDPLVHYRLDDLLDPRGPTNTIQVVKPPTYTPTNSNLGRLNTRYKPWGGNPQKDPTTDQNAYNRTVKDPLVRKSDDWDFPHTKYPNIGWLGRVHRGTPWQTIYFKSEPADMDTWERWAGSRFGRISHPTNDWRLADLFTVAPHPEATRGLMPVNQTNLAAWSATLSGILVVSNALPDDALGTNSPLFYADVDIKPNSPELYTIWNAITQSQANQPQQRFTRVSELLAIPELTVRSPFLNISSPVQEQRGIPDFAYESIPQKLLSLLRMDDSRYVIYSWGQSLRPANRSIQVQYAPNDPRFQLCTNYTVTGEVLTRTVVRFDDISTTTNQVRPRAVIESFNILPPE